MVGNLFGSSRSRVERPSGARANEQSDKLPPPHEFAPKSARLYSSPAPSLQRAAQHKLDRYVSEGPKTASCTAANSGRF